MSRSEFWLNGEKLNSISVQDRGLQYGDGFFSTILVLDQKLLNWSQHLLRIENSCQKLQFPQADIKLISSWLKAALKNYFNENFDTSCVVKIIMTRGEGGIGYQMPHQMQPNCLIMIKPSPVHIESDQLPVNAPEAIMLCQTKAAISDFAGIKHLNRLDNVFARTELADKGFSEGIMLNANQNVVSGSQSNLFIVKDQQLFTPDLSLSGVAGTTRNQLINLCAANGWRCSQQDLTLDDIKAADELFFCNAVRGIQPVNELQDKIFTQNLTNQIQQLWSQWQIENATAIDALEA